MSAAVVEQDELVRVLLIEDDEDDYLLVREMFAEIKARRFHIDWIQDSAAGLEAMVRNEHDVVLLDYRLGAETGIDLLRGALKKGCRSPVILLTGLGEREIDLEAMRAGAADYLVKGTLDASLLERSIRYAVERRRAAQQAAADQTRLAAFGEEVGLALAQRGTLDETLRRCARAMVKYLNAAAAYIWVHDPADGVLHLRAGSGAVSSGTDEVQGQEVLLDPQVVRQGKAVLISPVGDTVRMCNPLWAKREDICACAVYPLTLEDRLVGMLAVFARTPLTEGTLREMASVANGIALCVQRKLSEEALAASEVKYRAVVESVKEVIFRLDDQRRISFLNPAWTTITGFATEKSVGRPFEEFVHPEDRERQIGFFRAILDGTRSCFRQEFRLTNADGGFRWVEGFAQPTFGGREDRIEITGTLGDVSERKRAEAEIQKIAAFPRFNPEPVLELTADGRITYLNDAAWETARQLGAGLLHEMLPFNTSEIVGECLRTGESKMHQEVSQGGRTLSWSFLPVTASQVVHVYGTDITERLNLESQLRHAQKLESIGQLAAGVAHDFNNVLTVIQGHADRLLRQFCGDEALEEPLRQISSSVGRAASLTRQLLTFSRKQVMQMRVLDLNAVLKSLAKMLPRLLGEHILIELVCHPDLPAIEADSGMIEQVIMNLSVNARDAMPNGGRLRIETAVQDINEEYVSHQPEARTGPFVRLSVIDNGHGMSRETLARVFEPFFTTKEVGKGTGLGLATVYGIVKQHQGWTEVSSEPGRGTVFRVYLPASDRPVDGPEENTAFFSKIRGGNETILLVEDEAVLRELARTILRDYHYDVIEASSGVEALKMWDRNKGRVDLLLTDLVMPEGMSGRELAQQLKSRKPDLKVIFTSGYSPEFVGDLPKLRDVLFLPKPYRPQQLARVVRDCLDY
jgi:PAS domain S-box-containing protein